MQAHNTPAKAAHRFSKDTVLWLGIVCSGFGFATLLGAGFVVAQKPWLFRACRDAFAFGFGLPAWAAFATWLLSLRKSRPKSPARTSSAAAQLASAVYVCGASALGLAQGYAGHAWVVGDSPISLSIAIGTAALSPLAVWRVRPDWLRLQEQI